MTSDRPTKASPALRQATGHDYADWFALLDAYRGEGLPSADLRRWLVDEQGLSRWWAQKLVVEYEQHHGIRQAGARPDGTITITVSRTIAAPRELVYDTVADPTRQRLWAPDITLEPRTARPQESVRFEAEGNSRVNVHLASTAPERTQVSVEHQRLGSTRDAQYARAAWATRLAALKELLERTHGVEE